MASIYVPLQHKRPEIRLLNLEPRSKDSSTPIQAQLETADLWNAGEYTCLSYRWGNTRNMKAITVDGCEFRVRSNLYDALKRLQLVDKPRRLWVDAICINQDDIPEREAQVGVMQYIFENATDVIAWAGEAEGGNGEEPVTQHAIDFVRELSRRGAPLVFDKTRPPLDDETLDWIQSVTPWGMVDSAWLGFLALVERPWFSRIWIIQEVAFAKTVVVWCGHHRLNWEDFLYASLFILEYGGIIHSCTAPACLRVHDPETWRFFYDKQPMQRLNVTVHIINSIGELHMRQALRRLNYEFTSPLMRGCGIYSDTNRFFTGYRLVDCGVLDPAQGKVASPRPSFYAVVKQFRLFNASDHRDKIYALIGIADAIQYVTDVEEHSLPRISYAPDVKIFDVIWDLLGSEIYRRRCLDFLNDACGIKRPHGFPSWMPLWYDNESSVLSTACPLQELETGTHVTFNAGKAFKASAWMDKATKTLHVATLCFSPIVEVSGVFDHDLPEPCHQALLQVWASMHGMHRIQWVYQLLVYMKMGKRMSADWARRRLQQHIREHQPDKERLYTRFFGTILGSASAKGTEQICNPDPGEKVGAKLQKMASRAGKKHMHALNEWEHHVANRIAQTCHGRRMFLCGSGLRAGGAKIRKNFGLCPRETRVGDFLVLFSGAKTPHVIRMLDERDQGGKHVFGLVGEAYVHSWMKGQVTRGMRGDERPFVFPLR